MNYVAPLRGINVGGKRKVDMNRLRAAFERAGMQSVRAYINSGNVIFWSDATETLQLMDMLESTIHSEFGFAVPVFLRDASTMRGLVETLPESWVDGKDAKCDIMFLSKDIDREEILNQLMIKLVGTELYANMTVRN